MNAARGPRAATTADPPPQLLVRDRDPDRAAEHLADDLVVRRARHHPAVAPLVRRSGADRQLRGHHQVDLPRQAFGVPGELVQYPGQLFVPLARQVGHGSTVAGPTARRAPTPTVTVGDRGRRTGQ